MSASEILGRSLTVTTVLLAVLAASWLLLSPWTTRTNHMLMAVGSLSTETEVLVLGTSHVDCGIDPSRVDVPLVNLSGIATNYVCLEGVSEAHLDELPNLRLVVIEADVFPLRYDTLAVLDGDLTRLLDLAPSVSAMNIGWRDKTRLWKDQWLLYNPVTAPFLARDKLIPGVVQDRIQRRSLAPEIDVCGTGEAAISPGFRAFDQVISGANDGSVKASTHERESSHNVAANVEANAQALARIIDSILDRGISVVLLRLPHHSTYRRHRSSEMSQQFDEAIDSVLNQFATAVAKRQLQIWDMEDMPELTDQDFYDGDHLNGNGAENFTRQFNRHLNDALRATPGAPPVQ